jgi:phenylpyruvate tautomerase PptA (4-oxalocrotonate tautomerase family)
VSIVSEATLESALVLPAASVADAVMLYVASVSELIATLHAPNWSAVVVAISDVPEYSLTMA